MSTEKTNLQYMLSLKNLKLSHLAAKLNINKSSVTRWSKSKVPFNRVFEVEEVTGIPREFLRPDIFSAAPRKTTRRREKEAAE